MLGVVGVSCPFSGLVHPVGGRGRVLRPGATRQKYHSQKTKTDIRGFVSTHDSASRS
jgi:hypothetical protein